MTDVRIVSFIMATYGVLFGKFDVEWGSETGGPKGQEPRSRVTPGGVGNIAHAHVVLIRTSTMQQSYTNRQIALALCAACDIL